MKAAFFQALVRDLPRCSTERGNNGKPKVSFPTIKSARRAAEYLSSRPGGSLMGAYRCGDHAHVTRASRRDRRLKYERNRKARVRAV